MATLIELVNEGTLHRFDPQLGPLVQEERSIYVWPVAREWIEGVLPNCGSSWNISESPEEQFDALTADFCAGEELQIGLQLKPLVHHGDGIWELKTADLRMFGWFIRRDCFVCSACNTADVVKEHNLYHGYCQEAVKRRDVLDLDEPKFVAGDDPNAVVSNFSYS